MANIYERSNIYEHSNAELFLGRLMAKNSDILRNFFNLSI